MEDCRSLVVEEGRRLAAVMFTDLVGFTKLGQRDEEVALRLRREHQALVRATLAAHNGREVKTLGDGFLIEFPSAVESVRCAVAIQEGITARNAAARSEEPIVLRIGVHLGDVIGEGGDIVGDAVNVASRIEPLAEPGGICVSGPVFDQVRNKIRLPFEKIGARALKNVEHPVDVYRILLPGTAAPARASASAGPAPNAPPRLAILPLANMSPDPNDDFFADGLTDELISQVSKIPTLRVIARTSVLRYKRSTKSIREIARELEVGLAIEGTVRKAGNRLRITVQLVDPGSEEPIWSSRYDRPLDDIFAIQDDIASQVASSLSGHLSSRGVTTLLPFAHPAPDTTNLEAYTQFLRARKQFAEMRSEGAVREVLGLFESAVQLDPRFARARVGIAETVLWLAGEGAYPYLAGVERARQELTMALALDETLAEAHSALAGLLVGADEFARADEEARRAMELNPSLSDTYRWLAQLRAGEGKISESVRLLEAAQKLNPVDINIVAFLGRSYVYAGRDAEALAHWERTMPMVPFRTRCHMVEYYLGRKQYARADELLKEMEQLRPDSLWSITYRAMWAAYTGDPASARAALERIRARRVAGDLTAFFEGFVRFALDDRDAFVAHMEEAFRLHALPLLELQYSALFAAARADPRISDLLRRQESLR